MGVFDNKNKIAKLEREIDLLKEENEDLKTVIRQLKENHAVHVDQLKDKIKQNREAYESELNEIKEEYSKWSKEHRGYSETLRQLNESLMVKDIELNDIMNKIILK